MAISLTHQGKLHYIQYHHIFPKNLLQKAGYEKAEINEIANMAFISGETNRRISNKDPKKYLASVIAESGVKALRSQCIPEDDKYHDISAYREFLSYRREALCEAINQHFKNAIEG